MNFIFARLGVSLYGYFKYAAHRLGGGFFRPSGGGGLTVEGLRVWYLGFGI